MIYRWYIFSIFSLQYLLLYFHRVCPAVLAPEFIRDFGISGIGLGILSSSYFYPYSLMQVPVGILSDRWGARKTATLFGMIGASGAILLALSTNINSAVISRILIGLGVSAIFVPAMKVFGMWFKTHEYAQVSGLFMAIGTFGWFLGTTPLAALSEAFNWRGLFISVGIITALLTVLTWIIVRDRPESQKPDPETNPKMPTQEDKKNLGIKHILADKQFWPLAVWFFLRVGILFGFFGLWAGPYLMDVYGLQKVDAGNILSIVPLAIIIGTPIFGYLSDKVFISRKQVIVGSSMIHCICWALLVIFYNSLPTAGLYILFFVTGMMAGSPASVGFSAVKESFSPNLAGTTIGATNLAGFFGGLIFQPVIGYSLDIIGRVKDAYPAYAYRLPLQIFLGASAFALISAFLTRETLRRSDG